jgi:hypothetical protein
MALRTPQRAKKHSSVKNYLVPHEGNGYHPKLFRTAAVVTLVLAIVIFEGAYIIDTKLALNRTSFLASVLPAALLDLTNADRTANGVAPLQNDPELAQAAQLKADDMAANGYFAHVSPSGKTPWYWLEQVGYQYTYAGENLAINFDDSSAVEEAWMNSPTHHANIVKPQYTRVGYAVAYGTYEGKDTTFVVQEFATKPADETVTKEVKPKNPIAKAVETAINSVKAPEAPVPAASSSTNATETPAAGTQEVAGADAGAAAEPLILGTQAGSTKGDSGITNFLKQVAASPMRTSTYVLGGLAALLILLLGIALAAHAKVRYLEVLAGGLIVIIFALSVLMYNATHALQPIVPNDSTAVAQSASL